jgi:TetR/AcrR family acrAB operon transcriptional repressor
MAINGIKSAYPALHPAGAFLRDLEIMLRMLVAGAVSPAPKKPRAATPKPAKKAVPRSTSRKPGDRR